MDNNNKTIAKNTLFLYFRMMVTMVVSLFTSRVILQVLGVDDYGIYQTVGGIVGFLSFINGALASGSSRFLTFALGEHDKKKFETTFSTTLTIHIVLSLFTVIIAEIVGLWFLYNKLVIPTERFDAALFVFQMSILASVFSITQVPYNASIIAHERLNIYAYISIVEAFLKLGICYMLYLGDFDKLKMYSVLILMTNIGVMMFERIYAKRNFEGTDYKIRLYDKSLFKNIASFSSWSLLGNGTVALNNQGILILLNMFFSPAVVAARSISIQVLGVTNQFVNNFRTAANPQIIKKFASGDVKGSEKLAISSTKYSYYLMWLVSLPIILLADPLLHVWLGVVPEYTIIFLQLVLIQGLLTTINSSLLTPLTTAGRLKENALLSPLIGGIKFIVVYILFKIGFNPVALSVATIISEFIIAIIIKPILVNRIVGYEYSSLLRMFAKCLEVSCLSVPAPLLAYFYVDKNSIVGFLAIGFTAMISSIVVISLRGIDKKTRIRIIEIIKNKIKK